MRKTAVRRLLAAVPVICALLGCAGSGGDEADEGEADSDDGSGGESGPSPAGGGPGAGGNQSTGGDATGGSGATGGTGGVTADSRDEFIATNNAVFCALSNERTVCWGTGELGQTTYPELTDVVALVGDIWIHALTADGTVYALELAVNPGEWQEVGSGIQRLEEYFLFDFAFPDVEPVIDVATLGTWSACFVRASDRQLGCDTPYSSLCGVPASEFAPPPGQFQSVSGSARGAHYCGIGEDGTVSCWGAGSWDLGGTGESDGSCALVGSNITQGQNLAPPGTFTFVSAGPLHSCGVRTDGTVACWGAGTTSGACEDPDMACGQSLPPAESGFIQVATGYRNSCGLKGDGSVVCWGSDLGGRSTPPPELQP